MAHYSTFILLISCLVARNDAFRMLPESGFGACGSATCPVNTQCVEDPKVCVRAPCPQYNCVPANPCMTIKCRSGYECVSSEVQCFRTPCPRIGKCVKVDGDGSGGYFENGGCPSNEGKASTCDYTDCMKDGCGKELKCCPKPCGGTSCQKPV